MTFDQTYENTEDITWGQEPLVRSLIPWPIYIKVQIELKDQVLEQACWQINGPEVWHIRARLEFV